MCSCSPVSTLLFFQFFSPVCLPTGDHLERWEQVGRGNLETRGTQGSWITWYRGNWERGAWGIREHWGGEHNSLLSSYCLSSQCSLCWFSLYSVFPSSVPMLPSIPSIVSQYSSCSCCSPCSCSQCSWFPVLVFLVFSVFQCFSVPPSPYSQCLQILFCSQKGTLGTWENQGIIGSGT